MHYASKTENDTPQRHPQKFQKTYHAPPAPPPHIKANLQIYYNFLAGTADP